MFVTVVIVSYEDRSRGSGCVETPTAAHLKIVCLCQQTGDLFTSLCLLLKYIQIGLYFIFWHSDMSRQGQKMCTYKCIMYYMCNVFHFSATNSLMKHQLIYFSINPTQNLLFLKMPGGKIVQNPKDVHFISPIRRKHADILIWEAGTTKCFVKL